MAREKRERKISPFAYETLGEKRIEKNIKENVGPKSENSLDEWKNIQIKEKQLLKTIPITYLSYSQMQTFDICPLHYKLKYIMKIPTEMTSAQSFGTSVHSALKIFYQNWQNGNKLKINNIKKILEGVWINEGYSSKNHERKAFEKATLFVTRHLKNNFDKKNLPLALEYPFNFMLGNIKIAGRIDRIDKFDQDKIEIIDYKTGGNIPSLKELNDDLQLTFYALAATKVKDKFLYKSPESILLSLYYLDKDIKLTTIRSKNQLEEAKSIILKKVNEIAKSDFKCSGSLLCKNCEYKMLCLTSS